MRRCEDGEPTGSQTAGLTTIYVLSRTPANPDPDLYSACVFATDTLLTEEMNSQENAGVIWETGLSAGRYARQVTNLIDRGLARTVGASQPATWVLASAATIRR